MTNLKNLLAGKPEADKSLEEIIKSAGGPGPLFNNAAQVWNHDFYWTSMKPNGGGEPTGKLLEAIKKDFGSYAEFKGKFQDAAVKQFASGWAWLVNNNGKLEITTTSNAETTLTKGVTCLLTCDVWEHAYYIDYRNLRAKYVETFLNSLVNWDFASGNFK